jgi:hypothetical protein
VLFEPINAVVDKYQCIIPKVVQSAQGGIALLVFNMSKDTVILPKNTFIGHLGSISSTDIHVPNISSTSNNQLNTSVTDDSIRELKELLKINTEMLDVTQGKKLDYILAENMDIFGLKEQQLNKTHSVKHRIDTGNHVPVKCVPRRYSDQQLEHIDMLVEDMLLKKVIKRCDSPWNTPILLVYKNKTDLPRFCLDFRALNKVTRKEVVELPRTEDLLNKLGGSKIFSVMDLKSAYHQIPLEESSKEKTAFTTRKNQYCFQSMPFGISNATSCLTKILSKAFTGYAFKFLLCYLDDILCYSNNVDDHIDQLGFIFQRLKENGFTLNVKNVNLYVKRYTF